MIKVEEVIYDEVEEPTPNGITVHWKENENSKFVLDKVVEISKKHKGKKVYKHIVSSTSEKLNQSKFFYYYGGGFYSESPTFGGRTAASLHYPEPSEFFYYRTIFTLTVYLE